jgi:ABC-type sugar transport system substrate-binding protein
MSFRLAVLPVIVLAVGVALLPGCGKSPGEKQLTVGVAFETLQTEYWVASFETLKAELAAKNVKVLEAVADGDANRQLEQVNGFITRKVDGIIVVPKDGTTVLPVIKAANRANVPIVLYNRPPAKQEGQCVTVVADNLAITKDTVKHLCELAKKTGKRQKAVILMGDLSDLNAVARRDGFDATVKEYPDAVEVIARIPTEWNQEKALAGLTNALQANPDVGLVFASSDFLFPAVVSALSKAGRYKKAGEDGHVILGGFDGDATAYQMLKDGYLDADGVQDMQFECAKAVEAILKLKAGEKVDDTLRDPGFVIHRGNLDELAPRMWGAKKK